MKLGDKLYRYVQMSGIWEYKIIKKIESLDGINEFVVECQSCTHGRDRCQLLIAENAAKDIKYVGLLNESDDEPQEHWHKNIDNEHFFYRSKNKCKYVTMKRRRVKIEESISDARKKLEEEKKKLAEFLDILKTLEIDLNNEARK